MHGHHLKRVAAGKQASSSGVQVGVEKVTLNGRIRLTLKPLMDDMPIVAAIQVSQQLWLAHMGALQG